MERWTLGTEQKALSPVEFTVTACHALRGSGSSEINVTEGGTILPMDCDDTVIHQRGFQHLNKSTTTTSSLRILAAHKGTIKHGAPRNFFSKRRGREKRAKISSLEVVVPSPEHVLHMEDEENKRQPIFFSGTSKRNVPNQVQNSVVYSAIMDMKVVDTVEGARMDSESGDNVFVLIPRKSAITKLSHVKRTLQSLRALDKAKGCTEKRGFKRMTVPESENSNYVTVGLKPNRGGPGILDSWPHTLSAKDKARVIKLMTACHEVANGYIKSEELRGIQITKLLLQWSGMQGCGPKSVLPSFSQALNTYLSLHTDDDFFYSILTTASAHALREDIDQYNENADVSNYFVFAEQGIAVALRPGDMLIFNPKYHHCLSSRTSAYENKNVFSLSLYLKSAVVGKNDNTIPLKKAEIELLDGMINL
jgi:hypothetical protein